MKCVDADDADDGSREQPCHLKPDPAAHRVADDDGIGQSEVRDDRRSILAEGGNCP